MRNAMWSATWDARRKAMWNATWLDTSPRVGAFRRIDRAWATSTRPGLTFIDTPLATVRARIEGNLSPTILFAADPPNVLEHYDALFAEVTPWARAACIELPGFGFSMPRPGFSFDVAATSRVVQDVLAALGRGPFVLAFPCVSGFAALRVASAEPERVSHVALTQTPSWADMVRWSKRVDPRGLLAAPVIGQALMRLRTRSVARGWYGVAAGDDSTGRALSRDAGAAFDHGAAYCLASAFQATFAGPPPDLGARRAPGLIAWGTRDRRHRKSDPNGASDYLAGASVARFEAGHFPDLEAPGAFAALLKSFVTSPANA